MSPVPAPNPVDPDGGGGAETLNDLTNVSGADAAPAGSVLVSDGATWGPSLAGPITSLLDISGCVLLHDAQGLSGSEGDPLASFPDTSGSGFTPTQAISGNKPTLHIRDDGLKVVRFAPFGPGGLHLWVAETVYSLGDFILDDSFNVQEVTTAGTSDVNSPTWATTPGDTTDDNDVQWTNRAQGDATAQFFAYAGAALAMFRNADAITAVVVDLTPQVVNPATTVSEAIFAASDGAGNDATRFTTNVVLGDAITTAHLASNTDDIDTEIHSPELVSCGGPSGGGDSQPFPLANRPAALVGAFDFANGRCDGDALGAPVSSRTFEQVVGPLPDTDSDHVYLGRPIAYQPGGGFVLLPSSADLHLYAIYNRALTARERRLIAEYISDRVENA